LSQAKKLNRSTKKTGPVPLLQKVAYCDDKSKKVDESKHSQFRTFLGVAGYAVNFCRYDMSFSQGHLGRMASNPTEEAVEAVRHQVDYMISNASAGIRYPIWRPESDGRYKIVIDGYADSDWKGCPVTSRSTGSHVICVNGSLVVFSSKLLPGNVKMSATEAEYGQIALAGKDTLFVKNIIEFLCKFDDRIYLEQKPIGIWEDNKGTCDILDSTSNSRNLRHLQHNEHFARDLAEQGIIKAKKVDTKENTADLGTKPEKNGVQMRRLLAKVNFEF